MLQIRSAPMRGRIGRPPAVGRVDEHLSLMQRRSFVRVCETSPAAIILGHASHANSTGGLQQSIGTGREPDVRLEFWPELAPQSYDLVKMWCSGACSFVKGGPRGPEPVGSGSSREARDRQDQRSWFWPCRTRWSGLAPPSCRRNNAGNANSRRYPCNETPSRAETTNDPRSGLAGRQGRTLTRPPMDVSKNCPPALRSRPDILAVAWRPATAAMRHALAKAHGAETQHSAEDTTFAAKISRGATKPARRNHLPALRRPPWAETADPPPRLVTPLKVPCSAAKPQQLRHSTSNSRSRSGVLASPTPVHSISGARTPVSQVRGHPGARGETLCDGPRCTASTCYNSKPPENIMAKTPGRSRPHEASLR